MYKNTELLFIFVARSSDQLVPYLFDIDNATFAMQRTRLIVIIYSMKESFQARIIIIIVLI